jgi:hypothetical protein
MDWIYLTLDRNNRQALVSTEMNLRFRGMFSLAGRLLVIGGKYFVLTTVWDFQERGKSQRNVFEMESMDLIYTYIVIF